MDFLKKIFGNKTNQQEENFVVDQNLTAQEAPTTHGKITPVSQIIPENNSTQTVPVQTATQTPPIKTPTQPIINSVTEKEIPIDDTSAFDELMDQAEHSVNLEIPEKPIDPEFEKIKKEIAKEEGIEIFPAE